jgi:hypothetical protein
MDHLVLPEGVKPWIQVAYEGQEDSYYDKDRGNFFDFYKTREWALEDVKFQPKPSENLLGGVVEGEEEKPRTAAEIETFFQTWLFFGLIIEVFALNDIPVTTQDFLVPNTLKTVHRPQKAHVVTTAKLPSLIAKWRQTSSRDNKTLSEAMKMIDFVGDIVDHHCAAGKDHRSVHQYGKVLWPVKDEVTTSIIAVASTLRKAARQIHNVMGKEERWPVTNSRILYLRIQRKWCKADAAMIMEDLDIDGQYYIAAAESHSLESLDSHYACTDHSCEAKISDGTYVTQHADGCETHDDYEPEPKFVGHLSPDYQKSPASLQDAVKDVLDAGHLPVLRWDYEQRGLATYGHERFTYSGEGKTPPYVAISHVWADGMGNPFDNSLPYCQFDRVQRLVDDLCSKHLPEKKRHTSPGFWMDTICCIVGVDKESKKYKSKSIASMREIYHDCVAVLIIEPWLAAIPSTAPFAEIAHRIYSSGWSRRLWTHQEGFLGRDVYYQFKDKPLSFAEVTEAAKEYERRMGANGYPITFPYAAASKTSFYYTGIKTIIENIREGRFSKDDRWIIYRHLAESLGHRSTTNVDDELLCVASVIGLDVGDYIKHRDTEDNRERTAELRMQAFLEELGRFHQGIIFNNYRRLTTPGFRWAPVSLLGHRASGLGDIDGSTDSKVEDYSALPMDDKHVELESMGLKVKINLTKHLTKTLGLNKRVVSIVLNDKTVKLPTVGLPVDYPGYTIKFPKGSGLTIDMAERRFVLKYSPIPNPVPSVTTPPPLPKAPSFGKVPTVKGLRGFGKATEQVNQQVEKAQVVANNLAEIVTYQYVVYVAENDVKWEHDRAYAIILQRPLGDPANQEFLAMIGLNSIGPGPRTFVQSLCSAVVRLVGRYDSYKVTAGLDVVDVGKPKTNWVVT